MTITPMSRHHRQIETPGDDEEILSSPSRFQVLTLDQLEALPDPEWLVSGILPRGGLGLLFGPSGIGKSFLALDLALCVATGTTWFQHPVRRGPVVYLALESLRGFKRRVRAWTTHWEKPLERRHVRFVGEAPNLLEPDDVSDLARAIRGGDPVLPSLVVVDTLARAAGSADENAAKDMGQVVAAIDHLRALLGNSGSETTILLVHHTPKANTKTPRGSSALLGAVDVALGLDGEADCLTLTVEKLRDGDQPPPLRLRLERTAEAAVVVPDGGHDGNTAVSRDVAATLRSLAEAQLPEGLLASEWEKAAGRVSRTFYRHRKTLLDNGFVEHKKGRYRLTEAGTCQLTPR